MKSSVQGDKYWIYDLTLGLLQLLFVSTSDIQSYYSSPHIADIKALRKSSVSSEFTSSREICK